MDIFVGSKLSSLKVKIDCGVSETHFGVVCVWCVRVTENWSKMFLLCIRTARVSNVNP
jgi:hypothetical protein